METPITTTWPPQYKLRLSRKAVHAHLRVIKGQGLEVVIPARYKKHFSVDELLAEKKPWIQKHLAALAIKPLQHIYNLNLQAIGQTWSIEYKQTDSKNVRSIVLPGNHKMVIYGNTQDVAHTHRYLQTWLKEHARVHLLPWLHTLSMQHQLPYGKSAIRAQQTLWGSCTGTKNISLNYKLLFLPTAHAEHVMLHELCHTKYLDHSPRFWKLLTMLDPNTELHNAAIREADTFIPCGL